MISPEIRSRIKELEIHTCRMLRRTNIGDFRTAIKGSGVEFESLREYIPGDDVRFIDWPATARSNTLLVRQYYEERSRTIMLLLDGSASTVYGRNQARFDRMREIAAVLALAGLYTRDNVGLVIFSDDIVWQQAPARCRTKIHRLIETMYEYQPQGTTNFCQVLKKLSNRSAKNTLYFFISDFMGYKYTKSLSAFARNNEVVAIACTDQAERELLCAGMLELEDPETHERVMIDMRSTKGEYAKFFAAWHRDTKAQLLEAGVDTIDIDLDKPYMTDVIKFLARRLMYR